MLEPTRSVRYDRSVSEDERGPRWEPETRQLNRKLGVAYADLLTIGQFGVELPADSAPYDVEDIRWDAERVLFEAFEESPEAEGLEDGLGPGRIVGIAEDEFGDTLATLSPARLRKILVDLLPKSFGPELTHSSIHATHALYRFLQREIGIEAGPYLAVLRDAAQGRADPDAP